MNPADLKSESRLDISMRAMLLVSIPVSLGYLVQFFVAFTDNFFASRIDGNAMSAAALVGLIYITFVMLGVGLANAAQILVARRKGESRNEEVGKVVGNAFWIAVITAVLQFMVFFLVIPSFLDDVLPSKSVVSYMKEFMNFRAAGFLFYTPTLILNAFWSGIAKTRIMMYTTIITSLVNLILGYGLIFGNFGMPEMGIAGAGLAATLSEACAFLFAVIYTWYSASQRTYGLQSSIGSFNLKGIGEIFRLGLPISLQMMLALGIWTVFYKFVGDIGGNGENELQASTIVRNMYLLMMVSAGGFGVCTKTYVSGLIAEGRQGELLPTIRRLMILNFVGILLLSHGLWLYPEWIATRFHEDPVVIAQTVDCMRIVLPAMLVFAFTSVLLAVLEGSGNTMKGFIVELITVLIYIGAAYIMVYLWKWPVHLVWTADYIYFLLIGILSLLFLWNGKWKYHRI